MTTADALEKGRDAFARRAWAAAYAELSTAERDGAGGPADLERLAVAAYLVGRDAESADAWSRAYRGYADEGDVNHAALCGFHLGMGFMNQGEMARAGGWFARAQRLLDESGLDCVARGYLLVPDALRSLMTGIDPDPSVTINVAASAFPHGLEQLSTTAVAIGLTPASSPLPEARVTLRRTISDATAGGDTDTAGGIASTRRGAAAWSPLTGVDPTGDWQLALRTTGGDPYAVGQLSDLVMIVSWRGDAPAWPD